MGFYDSGAGDSIPVTVSEEPVDSTFILVNQLKSITSDIGHIKEYHDTLHHQVNILTDAVGHLTSQSNYIWRSHQEIKKSLKLVSRDLRALKDKQNITKSLQNSSTIGQPQQRSHVSKGQRPPSKQPWAHALYIEEALQENLLSFVENLSFSSTHLPDTLLELECLSDDECSLIRSKHDKDQIRHLLYKLMVRGPEKIFAFLDLLDNTEYSNLRESVYKSLERIQCEQRECKIHCLTCHVKKTVDLRDVNDYLFQIKLIKRDTYGAIMEAPNLLGHREFIWSNIINDINGAENIDTAMDHLIEAMKGKYDHLTEFLMESRSNGLQCVCGLKRRRRQKALISDVGSQTDMSTTSEIPKFMKLHSNDSQSDTESASNLSSMELGASYANLQPYVAHLDTGPCDSTTPDINEPTLSATNQTRSRHSSGKFAIQQGHADSTTDYQRQQSTVYIGSSSPDSSTRPPFQKSISHLSAVTVRPAHSTQSGDSQDLTDGSDGKGNSSSKTASPIEVKDINLVVKLTGTNTTEDKPFDLKENKDSNVDIPNNVGSVNRPKWQLRRMLAMPDGEESACADVQDDEVPLRKRTSKKRFKRQRNVATILKTPSKIAASARQQDSNYMKKKTKQRKERRERKLQRFEDNESFGQGYPAASAVTSHNPRLKKVPYNPTWLTHVQRPRSSHWDYNQARRHWLMSHRMAEASRNTVTVDTDQSWTEGSDTFG